MDFDKLLKQASVKQKVAEKKHVQQKQLKDEAKKREVEEKRKEVTKRKDMKEAARRKQLEYKGLISPSTGLPTSSAALLTSTASSRTQSSASSTPGPIVSGATTTPQTTLSHGERDKDKKRAKIGSGSTTKSSPIVSDPSSTKRNRHAGSGGKESGKHSLNNSISGKSSRSDTSRSGTSKPVSSSSLHSSKVSTNSHKVSTSSSSSASKSRTTPSVKSKPKPAAQMKNFEELMKTAKKNSSEKGSSGGGKTVSDGGRLPEPPRTSSSPVGKSLLERHHSRLKNKRNFETMMRGDNPRESLGASSSSLTKSGQTGLSSSPAKSSDLVRRPLHNSATPTSLNGVKKNDRQSDKRPLERRENGSKSTSTLSSRGEPSSSKGQGSSASMLASKEGGVRGSKVSFPPLSSLTPQQIQKLKAARAAAAAASAPPPKKKKPVNPTAFYGSAAARILQRKGQPKLSHGGSLKYTSSYVDEMLEGWQLEGVNGVDDLYSDEGEEEDFIASDDEFIDDSEECEDYSSAIRKIFGYDRRRYADYEDGDDAAMESSYAQQEFEEIRSARIGRQEDEEDIRKEQQQLAKKQGKKLKPAGGRQTKLSFR